MASNIPQTFWSSPIRYLRWCMHEKPAIFWSIVVGSSGPPLLYALPSIRRRFGDEDPPPVPHTYPGEYTVAMCCEMRLGGLVDKVEVGGHCRGE